MAYSDFGAQAPRQMFDVTEMHLKCADCGMDITELPFKPSLDRPVYCRDCNRKRKGSFRRGFRS